MFGLKGSWVGSAFGCWYLFSSYCAGACSVSPGQAQSCPCGPSLFESWGCPHLFVWGRFLLLQLLQISCCFSSDTKVIEGTRHPDFCCAALIKCAVMKCELKQKVHLPFLSHHYSPSQPLYFVSLSAVLLCWVSRAFLRLPVVWSGYLLPTWRALQCWKLHGRVQVSNEHWNTLQIVQAEWNRSFSSAGISPWLQSETEGMGRKWVRKNAVKFKDKAWTWLWPCWHPWTKIEPAGPKTMLECNRGKISAELCGL